jgi:hypothetical protein
MQVAEFGVPFPEDVTLKEPAKYLLTQGLGKIVDASEVRELDVNEKLETVAPYKPNLIDLCNLHRLITLTKRTTILEFGTGWSTWVIADALAKLKKKHSDEITVLRRNNPFELHVVDDDPNYIGISKSRLTNELINIVTFYATSVRMGSYQDKICTYYDRLPLVNPDLIYIDGPDQFNVKSEADNGWSTRHKDLMPMSADLLRIEHFLTPGSIIIFDGRTANARFFKANMQRSWAYRYNSRSDQHRFLLSEEPLGSYSKMHIEFSCSEFSRNL